MVKLRYHMVAKPLIVWECEIRLKVRDLLGTQQDSDGYLGEWRNVVVANAILSHTRDRLSIDKQCQMVSPMPN